MSRKSINNQDINYVEEMYFLISEMQNLVSQEYPSVFKKLCNYFELNAKTLGVEVVRENYIAFSVNIYGALTEDNEAESHAGVHITERTENLPFDSKEVRWAVYSLVVQLESRRHEYADLEKGAFILKEYIETNNICPEFEAKWVE